MFAILLAFLFIPSAKPAAAAQISGAHLFQVCDMNEKGEEIVEGGHTTCQAYIAGVLDYHKVLSSLDLAPKVDVCIPKGVTLYDLHHILLNYLRKHGEHDSFIAAPAVTMALWEVYPCK